MKKLKFFDSEGFHFAHVTGTEKDLLQLVAVLELSSHEWKIESIH